MAISYTENMQTNTLPQMTRKQLKNAHRRAHSPFELRLKDHALPVICEQVLRLIPKKRMVVSGCWDNKPVVVKLFYQWKKSKIHYQRELRGIEALMAWNVPTPGLLYKGKDSVNQFYVLIFDRITDGSTLETLWQENVDKEELMPMMRAVIIELATQHVLGIIQRDLHLKNFLVTPKIIYTLDGGNIETSDQPLSKKQSLDHLGLFFSQLGVGIKELQKELFKVYVHSRGWLMKDRDSCYLENVVKQNLHQRWENFQKKIMRNSTQFSRISHFGSLKIYDKSYSSENFKFLLYHPDVFFKDKTAQLLKLGNSATVVKITLDGQEFVIKRYNMKNSWHWVRRCLRTTRAEHSWKLAHYLRLMGISTAKPIAFIENRFLGLKNTSYFIMEYISGQNSYDFFTHQQEINEKNNSIANRIIQIMNQLSELRLTHGDLKATNILLSHEKPVLIDLDGMKKHISARAFQRALKKEKQRFMQNWEKFPRIYDLFKRFFN